MAQNYKKLVSGDPGTGTAFADYPSTINDSMDTLRSDFSGNSFPTDPIIGQTFFNSSENKEYRYFGSPPTWQDAVGSSATVVALNQEVVDARGTNNATLSDRLIKISSNNANSAPPTKDVYVGMDFYDNVNKIAYKCTSMVDGEGGTPLWQPISEVIPAIKTTSEEVKVARGTADNLNARLDVALNEDGTLKGTAPAGEWWEPVVAYPMTIVNTKTVTVDGDLTAIFVPRRAVRTLPSYTSGIWVESVSYSAENDGTVINLTTAVLDTDTGIQFGAPVDNGNRVENIPVASTTEKGIVQLVEDAEITKDEYTEAELVALAKKIINARQFVELAGKGGLGVPLGFSCIWAEPYIPEGAILYSGELVTNFRSAYPDFYDGFIKTGKVHAKPMSEFASVTAPYWQEFFYDDTTGDVRVPKPAPYIGATAVDTASLGEYVEAGLPNITGTTWVGLHSSKYLYTYNDGCFEPVDTGQITPSSSHDWGTGTRGTKLDASLSNPTYGKSDTVTPEHMRGRWIGFVYNGSSTVSEAQVQEFVNLLAGKANAEDNVDGLVDYYPKTEAEKAEANGSWWRKYKSGWIEQGGYVAGNSPNILFQLPFSNTQYTANFSVYNTSTSAYTSDVLVQTRSTTNMNTSTRINGTASALTFTWETKGF